MDNSHHKGAGEHRRKAYGGERIAKDLPGEPEDPSRHGRMVVVAEGRVPAPFPEISLVTRERQLQCVNEMDDGCDPQEGPENGWKRRFFLV